MKIFFKPILAICLLPLLCSLSSCGDKIFSNCEEDYDFYQHYYIRMNFFEKETKQNLLVIGLNRYNSDTVQVYDENLNPLGYHPRQDGSIAFEYLYHTKKMNEPQNTPIEHTYYIYFEKGDYDTLDLTYQIARNKCNELVISKWSVSYNDSTYFDFGPIERSYVDFLKTPAPTKK